MPDKTKSLIVQSIVAASDRKPYVQVMLGAESAQFTPEEARAFGMQLITTACAAEADAAMFRFIKGMHASDAAVAAALQAFREVRLESEANPARQEWTEL